MNYLSVVAAIGLVVGVVVYSSIPLLAAPYVVVSALTISLYLSAIAGVLDYGESAIRAIGCVVLVASMPTAFLRAHKRQRTDFRLSFLMVPVFLIVFFTPKDSKLLNHDEFSFWGPSLKIIHETSRLWGSQSPIELKHYLPGQQLVQNFFLDSAQFDERSVLAIQIGLLSAGLLAVVGILTTGLFAGALGMATTLIAPFFFGFAFRSIYVDLLLSTSFAVSLATLMRRETGRISHGLLVISVTFGALLKHSGMILGLLAVFVYFVRQFDENRQRTDSWWPSRTTVLSIVTPSVAAIAPYLTWATYCSLVSMKPSTELGLFDGITNGTSQERLTLTLNAFNEEMKAPSLPSAMVLDRIPLDLPQVSYVAVIAILVVVTQLVVQPRLDNQRKKSKALAIGMTVSVIGYLTFLIFSYLFVFGEYEGIRVASLGRYVSTFLLAWTIVLVIVSTEMLSKRLQKGVCESDKKKILYSAIAFIAFVSSIGLVHASLGNQTSHPSYPLRRKAEAIAFNLRPLLRSTDKYYFVDQSSTGLTYWMFRYLMIPNLPQTGCWSIGKPYSEADVWTCDVSIKMILGQFEFLVVYNGDRQLDTLVASMSGNRLDHLDGIYEIVRAPASKTLLIPIRQTPSK